MTGEIQCTLPKESDAQRIGRLANKCFVANCPTTWAHDLIAGDNDYGFDYQVQTDSRRLTYGHLSCAIERYDGARPHAEGGVLLITLKASTVRYYALVTDPIMLVLCNLSVDESQPKNCPLYYVWIHDELRRFNQSTIPTDQKTIALRVPLSNRLDCNRDVSDYLKRFRDLDRASEPDVVVEEKYPSLTPTERAALISRIPEGFRARSPALLDVMCQEASTRGPDSCRISTRRLLKAASSQLQSGADDEAEASLTEAAKY